MWSGIRAHKPSGLKLSYFRCALRDTKPFRNEILFGSRPMGIGRLQLLAASSSLSCNQHYRLCLFSRQTSERVSPIVPCRSPFALILSKRENHRTSDDRLEKNDCVAPDRSIPPVYSVEPPQKGSIISNISYMLKGYASLSKFKLGCLVLATTCVGYHMAPGPFNLPFFALTSLGVSGTIASANSINQLMEIDNDSRMRRTSTRWLPTQRISRAHAATFAAVMGIGGGAMLWTTISPLVSVLAVGNILLYTGVYTPLKQRGPVNTWIGAVVGAVPPMIGWAAKTGGLEPGAWVLGAFLTLWQIPHFLSLSYSLRDDYHRGGFKMLVNVSPEKVPLQTLQYSAVMLPLGVAAAMTGMTTYAFALDSLLPTLYLCHLSHQFYKDSTKENSRRVFKYSLLHLPLLMGLMIFHRCPDNDLRDEEEILGSLENE